MTYENYYDYMTNSADSALVTGLWTGYAVIGLVMGLLAIVATWKIFKKASCPGWASLVPFYNFYTLFKITWGNGWFFLLMLIPIVNIVIYIMTLHKLSKAFGKNIGFTVGLVLLSTIFMLILGFGSAKYAGLSTAKNAESREAVNPEATDSAEPAENSEQL